MASGHRNLTVKSLRRGLQLHACWGQRRSDGGVDLYPPTGAALVHFDLLQHIFAELCTPKCGHNGDTKDCPGFDHGASWLHGDPNCADGKGVVKIGTILNCDTPINPIKRCLGPICDTDACPAGAPVSEPTAGHCCFLWLGSCKRCCAK